MTVKELKRVEKLAREADKAARVVVRNRFLIETYLSLLEAKAGKGRTHKSVDEMFKRLKV